MKITKLDELNEQFFDLMGRANAIGSNNLANPFFNTDVLWSDSEFVQEGVDLYKSLVQRVQEDVGNLDMIVFLNNQQFTLGPSPLGSLIASDDTEILVFHYTAFFGQIIGYPCSVPYEELLKGKDVLVLTDVVYDTYVHPNIYDSFTRIRDSGGNIKGLAALVVYETGTEGLFYFTKDIGTKGFDVPVYTAHIQQDYVVNPEEPQQKI